MVSVVNVEFTKSNKARVILHADDASEITDDMTGADLDELEDDVTLAPFSIAITSDFESAILGSDGKWNWKE